MEAFQEKLKESGLTGNEAKLYIELLQKGPLSANELAKKVGMDRTLAYTVLNHLIEKGLVNYVIRNSKKYFNSADPENLLNPVKAKETLVQDLISQLKQIKKIEETPFEINVYEGKEGLRSFLNLVLKQKEFCSFGATGRAFYALYEMPRIVKQVEKSNLKVRIIGNISYKGTPAFGMKKFEFRYLEIKSEVTTSIFGDYVSVHILTQKPFIILIKNKEIAEGYRNYFEVLWKIAKK
ncbi:MAG: helix-turn-helix domain-containing protein [Nanoarchaeota archaeon]|nr:helix-turn-helix domain-containing protein [Nanoarchaeota archaeon]